MDPQAFIRIFRLSHVYPARGKTPARAALSEVSLDIGAGEMLALLGPNGSGKSTLLRILTTALRPTGGQVWVDGIDVAKEPRAVRRQLGVVFQKPALDGKMSVQENLRAAALLYGMARTAIEPRLRALLDTLGLAGRRRERVEHLSGGLARRVELAKALLPRPRLLVLDEPTAGLDPLSRRDFWRQVAALRGEGTTVVVTTHLLDEAAVCDRVAIMHEGHLLACAPPADLQEQVGRRVLVLESAEPEALRRDLEREMGLAGRVVERQVRIALDGEFSLDRLLQGRAGQIHRLVLAPPSLDDVFARFTGRGLRAGDEAVP